MILPRSPSPVPLEEKPIDELTADEARELLRRQNVGFSVLLHSNPANQGQARIETREAKLKSEAKSKLKRERSSTTNNTKPAKVARTADGKEYIDLASDSEDGGATMENDGSKIEVLDLID